MHLKMMDLKKKKRKVIKAQMKRMQRTKNKEKMSRRKLLLKRLERDSDTCHSPNLTTRQEIQSKSTRLSETLKMRSLTLRERESSAMLSPQVSSTEMVKQFSTLTSRKPGCKIH